MNNKSAKKAIASSNDIYYTPKPVAEKMIEMCEITPEMTVLDPCYGGGVFYENLPECHKEWCEIEKGKDFFQETKRYDLIIGNPPYSMWNKWLEHTMKLTDKFCYIMGIGNLTDVRVRMMLENGYGITKLHLIKIDWWFGNQFIVLFEKNKPSLMTVQPFRVYCDICGTRCLRGRNANQVNECVPRVPKEKKVKN